MIFAFERLAAIANSRFHLGFNSDIRFLGLLGELLDVLGRSRGRLGDEHFLLENVLLGASWGVQGRESGDSHNVLKGIMEIP